MKHSLASICVAILSLQLMAGCELSINSPAPTEPTEEVSPYALDLVATSQSLTRSVSITDSEDPAFNRMLRANSAVTLLNDGRLLLIGGTSSPALNTADTFTFNSTTNQGTWARATNMNFNFEFPRAVTMASGKVFATNNTDIAIFNPTTNGGLGSWATFGTPIATRDNTGETVTLMSNGKVAIIGGDDSNGFPTAIELFDPTANSGAGSLVVGNDMSGPRTAHTTTLLQSGKLLVVGGTDDSYTSLTSAEIYNPGTGLFAPTGSLSVARNGHSAILLNDGRVLVVGGFDDSYASLNTTEIFDPAGNAGAGAWSSGPLLNFARGEPSLSLLNNGKVLIAFGYTNDPSDAIISEIYTPAVSPGVGTIAVGPSANIVRSTVFAQSFATNKVLFIKGDSIGSYEVFDLSLNGGTGGFVTPSSAPARSGGSLTLLPSGNVIALGGSSGSTPTAYGNFDPIANSGAGAWSAITAPAQHRFGHTATLLDNGSVAMIGGTDPTIGSSQTTVGIFDPTANSGLGSWSAGSALATARTNHTATKLGDGKVLVVGGGTYISATPTTYLTSVEIFSSDGSSKVAGPSITGARIGHSATLLQNGKVLIAGGYDGSSYLNSTMIYDPDTNGWAAGPTFTTARSDHQAVLLENGKVLIIGGYNGVRLTSVQIFDPAGNAGAGSFSAGPPLTTGRFYFAAQTLPNGYVIVTGGSDTISFSPATIASTEVYNPNTNTWASGNSALNLTVARGKFPSVVLADGRMMAQGGESLYGTGFQSETAIFSQYQSTALQATGKASSDTYTFRIVSGDGYISTDSSTNSTTSSAVFYPLSAGTAVVDVTDSAGQISDTIAITTTD